MANKPANMRRIISQSGSLFRESSSAAVVVGSGAGVAVVLGDTGAFSTGTTVGCRVAGDEDACGACCVGCAEGVGRDIEVLMGVGAAVGVGATGAREPSTVGAGVENWHPAQRNGGNGFSRETLGGARGLLKRR